MRQQHRCALKPIISRGLSSGTEPSRACRAYCTLSKSLIKRDPLIPQCTYQFKLGVIA